jgi:hypothetical protein
LIAFCLTPRRAAAVFLCIMRNPLHRIAALLVAATALAATGCKTLPKSHNHSFTFDPPVKQPANPSKVKVKLSTGAQRLYVVEGNEVLLATPVSVGKASSPTPQGDFRIYSKQANRRRYSNPGAGYPMTYWMEFKPAYGMHWGFLKPHPSTMGCVRMPLKSAQKVFDLVRVGTPLHIASSQPWDETHGKHLPALDDGPLPNPPLSYMLSDQVFRDARRGKLWQF